MDSRNSTKKALFDICEKQMLDRIKRLEAQLSTIRESRNNETKSSAGDKYETGRTMMQLEEEKSQAQLSRTRADLDLLRQLDFNRTIERVETGALVETSQGNYFFSISLGRIQLAGKDYYCISLQSPLGQALVGKTAGEIVSFRDRRIEIRGVM